MTDFMSKKTKGWVAASYGNYIQQDKKKHVVLFS